MAANSEQNKAEEIRAKRIKNIEGHKFQKGVSGNPSGRPKKKWLTEVAEELLEEKLSDPAFREVYKEQLWQKLMSGKVVGAMTLDRVWERTEGKLTQPVDVGGSIDIVSIIEEGRKRTENE